MITIFNRRELLVTYDTRAQSRVRTILGDHGIDYHVKVLNRTSPSPLAAGSRARAGSFGANTDSVYEYKIYVKKADYEEALALIKGCD